MLHSGDGNNLKVERQTIKTNIIFIYSLNVLMYSFMSYMVLNDMCVFSHFIRFLFSKI